MSKVSIEDLRSKFQDMSPLKHTVVGAMSPSQGGEVTLLSQSLDQTLDENTQFFIASVSKQFTAFMMLKALHAKNQGDMDAVKMDLHAPLSKTFEGSVFFDQLTSPANRPGYMSEELAEALKTTTIHELLTHTSGLDDFYSRKSVVKNWDGGATGAASPTPEQIEAELYKLICPWTDHIEGIQRANLLETKDFEYCNTNYTIVAKIIEHLTGMSFTDYSTELTKEFGLESTLNVESGAAVKVAEEYDLKKLHLNLEDPLSWNVKWGVHEAFGNGSLVSTVHDVLEWGPKLVSHPYHKLISAKAVNGGLAEDDFYGYGLFTRVTKSYGDMIFHPGEIGLYNSFLFYWPEQDMHMAILSCDEKELGSVTGVLSDLFE